MGGWVLLLGRATRRVLICVCCGGVEGHASEEMYKQGEPRDDVAVQKRGNTLLQKLGSR